MADDYAYDVTNQPRPQGDGDSREPWESEPAELACADLHPPEATASLPVRDDHDVVHAMYVYGGGFVTELAKLWTVADPENRRRIKATWADLWAEYTELAQRHMEMRRGR
jgi:hypothetical protein